MYRDDIINAYSEKLFFESNVDPNVYTKFIL